jgi:hypothetical protein
MVKLLPELLKEVNDNIELLDNYRDNFLLKVIAAHSFLPKYKMLLPEGETPHKADDAPLGMSPTNLYAECKRLYVFCREDLSSMKRESQWIGLLEGLHKDETKILDYVKDQKLHELYPNITWKAMSDAGIIPAPQEGEVDPSTQPVKRGRGRPKKEAKAATQS